MDDAMAELVKILKSQPDHVLVLPKTNSVYMLLPDDKILVAEIRDLENRTDDEIRAIIKRWTSEML